MSLFIDQHNDVRFGRVIGAIVGLVALLVLFTASIHVVGAGGNAP